MKWIILLLTVCTLTHAYAEEDLPMPLPDEPGHQYPEPNPAPRPTPRPEPEQPAPPSGQTMTYTLGVGDTGRFKERQIFFYPSSAWTRVNRITLTGVRNNVKIKSVRIYYADAWGGPSEDYSLIGDLKVGTTLQAYYDSRPISSIEVTATNKYFWKKPGGFRVDVTAYQ
ncbi:MAG: hypothetical protein J7501_05350 [Bdellovibrio sp.]|nr:hypothetical protein [Bdellovibrio sp.]